MIFQKTVLLFLLPVVFALAACRSQIKTPPAMETATPPLQAPVTSEPAPEFQPEAETPRPSETPPPATLLPSATPSETGQPSEEVKITVASCLQTFCPPFWLEEQAREMQGSPGIQDALGLNETDILIKYNPHKLSEEQVIQLFMDVTGLEAAP
jgi:hypothetical protein